VQFRNLHFFAYFCTFALYKSAIVRLHFLVALSESVILRSHFLVALLKSLTVWSHFLVALLKSAVVRSHFLDALLKSAIVRSHFLVALFKKVRLCDSTFFGIFQMCDKMCDHTIALSKRANVCKCANFQIPLILHFEKSDYTFSKCAIAQPCGGARCLLFCTECENFSSIVFTYKFDSL